MIDNLKGQEELEVEKIKVTEAEIVVRGTIDKPYYVIVYHEVGKDYNNEGFGSYCLENVFEWRNKRFEKVDENEQPKTDWIPCEERLPEPSKRYLVSAIWIDGDYVSKPTVYDAVFGTDGKWHTDGYKEVPYEVIAWQPLPQPYKKEGAE